jgi:hypothetical protein
MPTSTFQQARHSGRSGTLEPIISVLPTGEVGDVVVGASEVAQVIYSSRQIQSTSTGDVPERWACQAVGSRQRPPGSGLLGCVEDRVCSCQSAVGVCGHGSQAGLVHRVVLSLHQTASMSPAVMGRLLAASRLSAPRRSMAK